MSRLEKKFTLSHTIDINQVTYETKSTETETHFSIPWCMVYLKSNMHFKLRAFCMYLDPNEWGIETELMFKLKSSNGTILQLINERTFGRYSPRWEWIRFIRWRDIEKYYAENGKFMIEAHLVIKKMSGFGIEKLRYFDVSSQRHWDVVLNVDGHKFYLLKAFLASQSSYLESLLFGAFKESEETEVELKEVDHEDFQSFLELIYGEPAVNDTNIDGVLHLSDMYHAPTAIRRCEEFLIEKSKWSIDEKLKIAERYLLKDLMMNLQQASEEVMEEKLENVVVDPIKKKNSKTSWFSCIRKQ